MKKLFSILVVALFAVAASADVIWNESLDKNGSYINKADFGNNWPYATQWYAAGNFVYAYDSVGSYGVSVRNKKLNGADENSIGFFFSKEKAAASNYLYLGGEDGAIVEGAVNCKLMFDLCSPETNGGDAGAMVIKVNGETLPGIDLALGNKLITSPVEYALADGDIVSIEIAFDNVPAQKFISSLRIEGEAGKAHGTGGVTPVGPDTISVAEAVVIAEALAEPEAGKSTTDSKEVVVKGFAVQVYDKNSDGTWSFYMADEAGAYGSFMASNATADADVVKDDFMFVRGKIAKYKAKTSGNIILQIYKGTATHGEAPQGIENVVLTEKAQKVVVDGNVYIVRDGKMFNLTGAQVR